MSGLYFAYGSNMSTPRLRARLPHAKPQGRSWLDGHRLACNKRGKDGSGKANVVLSDSKRAWGVLFRIQPADWSTLDQFEVGYRREPRDVYTSASESVEAQLYIANSPERDDVPPFDWYRDYCLAGAREHALPATTIALIEGWRTIPDRA